MRIALCDDNLQDLNELECTLRTFSDLGEIEVVSFQSAAELYSQWDSQSFHIAILDIEMPAPNGFEIAKQLSAKEAAPIIIFLTQSMAYSLRGYGVAFRYLTKPIDLQELHDALCSAIAEAKSKRFAFEIDGTSNIIRMEDIYFFEIFNHYTVLHTMDREYVFRATLKEVYSALPPGYFASPHQSYIVNFAHIRTLKTNELHLTNGSVIPVSRHRQKEFKKLFYAYLGR